MSLNTRQAAFVRHVLNGASHAEAYMRAGYRARDPRVKASRLATNGDVRRAIEEGRAELERTAGVTRKHMIQALLREIAGKGADTSSSSRVRAIAELNRLLGFANRKNSRT